MSLIRVYTKKPCVQCDATRRKLTALGASFEEAEMTEQDAEAARYLGITTAPIVAFEDQVWGGFQPQRLEAAVEAQRVGSC